MEDGPQPPGLARPGRQRTAQAQGEGIGIRTQVVEPGRRQVGGHPDDRQRLAAPGPLRQKQDGLLPPAAHDGVLARPGRVGIAGGPARGRRCANSVRRGGAGPGHVIVRSRLRPPRRHRAIRQPVDGVGGELGESLPPRLDEPAAAQLGQEARDGAGTARPTGEVAGGQQEVVAGPRDRHVGQTTLLGQGVAAQGEPVALEQVLRLLLGHDRGLECAELEGRQCAGVGAQRVGQLVEPGQPRPVPDG